MSKQPPTSIYAEHSLLGAILRDGPAFDLISDSVTADSFVHEHHRMIFQAMQSLSAKNEPIDIVTVDAELKMLKLWEEKDGFHYLGKLAHYSPGSANIKAYADIIRKQETINKLRDVAGQVQAITDEDVEPSEMTDKAEALLYGVQCGAVRGGGPQLMSNVMAEMLDNLDTNKDPGLSTGFLELDELLSGGTRGGELIVLAGRPGSGKTTLGMNIATYAATAMDRGVLIFSMEMTAVSLAERIFASIARINLSDIRRNRMGDREWAKAADTIKLLSNNNIRIDSTPQLKPSELRARARREMRQTATKPPSLILVDYIQLMRADTKYDNRVNEIGECSGALKALANELNIPIIALAQLNRNSVNRVGDKRPTMSDLRDSGSIEQDADVVALIYRDEIYNEDSPDKGLAEIIVDKQRNGKTGMIKLTFDGEHNAFLNFKKDQWFV